MHKVFDEWGSFVGWISPPSDPLFGCFVWIIILTLGLLVFWVYLIFKMTIEGIGALLKGEIGEAIKLLAIPTLLLVVLMMLGTGTVIAGYTQEIHQEQITQEAKWAIDHPFQAFTITKISERTWSIKNNTNQIALEGVNTTLCRGTPQDPPLDNMGAYADIPPFGPGQTTIVTCDTTYPVLHVTLWSSELPWTKLADVDLP